MEYNNTGELMNKLNTYIKAHPEIFAQANPPDYEQNGRFGTTKYEDGSNFRHKEHGNVLLQQFNRGSDKKQPTVDQVNVCIN